MVRVWHRQFFECFTDLLTKLSFFSGRKHRACGADSLLEETQQNLTVVGGEALDDGHTGFKVFSKKTANVVDGRSDDSQGSVHFVGNRSDELAKCSEFFRSNELVFAGL